MSSFSSRLKELRKSGSITQKAVADYLGITEHAYQKYEYGQREPNHETTIKLADFWGVSLDYLFGRKNDLSCVDGNINLLPQSGVLDLHIDDTRRIAVKSIELLSMLNVRDWIYKFLAQALYEEPSEAGLKGFLDENLFSLMAAEGEKSTAVLELAKILEEMKSYREEDWEEQRRDHTALFSNSGPILATPWESVYLSEEKILYDEHTLAVQDFYKKWGIEAVDREKGPADHIGLECSFLAAMTAICMDNLQEGKADEVSLNLQAQNEFLKNHLLLFVDSFCASVAANAKSGLYQGVAHFLPVYLSVDAELLEAASSDGYTE